MTEPEAKPVAAPPARGPRWMRIALAVSLALNLAVAGVVAGAILRDGNPRARQDFGLGPLSDALTREDRRALREAFLDRHADLRGDRQAMRADFAGLIQVLRAEPFDPAALDTALQAIAARNADLLATGRALLADRLRAMSPQDRAAFADRLEHAVAHPRHEGRG
jgi:uncharacterized membrane protein